MNILIFGGSGTIGKPLVKLLEENHKVYAPSRSTFDGTRSINHLGRNGKYDYVINLIGEKTNITRNKSNPVDIYNNTVLCGMSVLDYCRSEFPNMPRLIQCVCSCSYAPTELLKEAEFDEGPVDPSIEAHGYAKRQLYYMSKFYRQQYNLRTLTLCFNNVYGGFDKNCTTNNLKVLDSLFLKMVKGKIENHPQVQIFGTGKPKREFIYFEDIAGAINDIVNLEGYKPDLAHRFNGVSFINIGSQEDITISELAQLIKSIVGYGGKLVYDKSKPDGQMEKLLDNSLFRQYFPNFKFRSLELGINQMMLEYFPDYYENDSTYRLVGE